MHALLFLYQWKKDIDANLLCKAVDLCEKLAARLSEILFSYYLKDKNLTVSLVFLRIKSN